jgi:hypothetical protein
MRRVVQRPKTANMWKILYASSVLYIEGTCETNKGRNKFDLNIAFRNGTHVSSVWKAPALVLKYLRTCTCIYMFNSAAQITRYPFEPDLRTSRLATSMPNWYQKLQVRIVGSPTQVELTICLLYKSVYYLYLSWREWKAARKVLENPTFAT